MTYRVMTYGQAILKEKAERVVRVDDVIRRLAKDMLATMYRANGVGLAAQQIGRRENICVLDVSPRDSDDSGSRVPEDVGAPMPLVMINAQITEMRGEQRTEEGCLSFPDVYVTLKRAAEVTAVFTDLEGNEQTIRARALLARAIQHEVDHLNGVLLVDRMSLPQRLAVAGKLKRLRQQAEE